MENSDRTTLAGAVLVGYLAGRTKKGKLLLGLLALAAGRGTDPGELVGQGVGKLTGNPLVAELSDQIRGELFEAGRAALSATTGRGVSSLTGALQQRTDSLLGSGGEDEEEPEDGVTDEADEDAEDAEDSEGDAYEDEDEQEPGEDEAEEAEEEPEPARRSRRRAPRRAEKPTDRKPGPKNPPAKKAMDRRTAARKTAEKRAPSSKSRQR